MIPKLNHTPMMSRVMTRTLAVVAAAKVDINPHVAVVNNLGAEEPRGEVVREAMGQIVRAAKSVRKITSHPSAPSYETQRQINMSWLQLFPKISNPEHVSNA